MTQVVKEATSRDVTVQEDPLEQTALQPSSRPSQPKSIPVMFSYFQRQISTMCNFICESPLEYVFASTKF